MEKQRSHYTNDELKVFEERASAFLQSTPEQVEDIIAATYAMALALVC